MSDNARPIKARKIDLRIPEDTRERLETEAKRDRRSLSNLVLLFIDEGLRRRSRRRVA